MPKAKTYCIAAGCRNNDRKPGQVFFTLPSGQSKEETQRCEKWLALLGREDILEKKDFNKRCYKVCSAHFDPSSLRTTIKLNKDAVPTLLLENYPHAGTPRSIVGPITTQVSDAGIWSKSQVLSRSPSVFKVPSTGTPIKEEVTVESEFKETSDTVRKNTETQTNKIETLEKSTQTSVSLTEGTPRKRKCSDELKKCKSKQRRLSEDIIKINQEMEAKNNPITCNDPDDEIARRFQKLINWRNNMKNKCKGNRYDAEYKLFALNLQYSSPHAYRCLQTVLKLPSKDILNTFKMKISPTLDNGALDSLALKMKSLPDAAKYCTISFDEMPLKRNLYYNISSDEIIGFQNVNGKTSTEIASNAFLIMLQGIYVNWKQPIAYAFLGRTEHYEDIDTLLNEVISKLSTMGIKLKAIVSHQGSNFDKFVKEIKKVTIEKPYFIYNNHKIYYIFDVPHLVTCIRNNLLANDFILDGKKVSWEYITHLYNDQKNKNLRLVPKITEAHLHPNNFQKMEVKLAVQILSRTVAAALHTYIDLGKMSEEARSTAEFIETMNNLFDVLNSSQMKSDNKFKTAFTLSKDQENILHASKKMFSIIKAINRKTGKYDTGLIKTFTNFQMSIQSIKLLHDDLRTDGFQFLLTRRLNQDNLENYFGCVRQQGGPCSELTPIKFQRAFSTLFVCNMIKNSPNTNCEVDIYDALLKAEDMVKMNHIGNNLPPQDECRNAISLTGETDYRIDLPDENALTYVSSYLLFKCINKHKCPAIDELLKSVQDIDKTNLFCSYKAYNKQASFYGGIKRPPKEFIDYVQNLEDAFTQNFEKIIQSNPGGKLLKMFQSVPPQTPCPCFPVEYLLKLFARFRIFATLKFNNRQFKDGKKYLKVNHL